MAKKSLSVCTCYFIPVSSLISMTRFSRFKQSQRCPVASPSSSPSQVRSTSPSTTLRAPRDCQPTRHPTCLQATRSRCGSFVHLQKAALLAEAIWSSTTQTSGASYMDNLVLGRPSPTTLDVLSLQFFPSHLFLSGLLSPREILKY